MFDKKIEFYSNDIPIDFLKDFIVTYPKNFPSYFKKIKKSHPDTDEKNIRTCSGFVNYFRRTILFKAPYDIRITIDHENNKISCGVGSGSFNFKKNLTIHDNKQFLDYIDNDDYSSVVKFLFEIYVKCDYPILINREWWNNFGSFEVMPGVLHAKVPTPINLFFPIRKDVKQMIIKQGTVLCSMNVETEKNIKIEFKKGKINPRDYNGLEYLFSNFKNKLFGNKFNA